MAKSRQETNKRIAIAVREMFPREYVEEMAEEAVMKVLGDVKISVWEAKALLVEAVKEKVSYCGRCQRMRRASVALRDAARNLATLRSERDAARSALAECQRERDEHQRRADRMRAHCATVERTCAERGAELRAVAEARANADRKVGDLVKALTRATERGERMARAIRGYAWAAATDAAAAWDARDTAGEESK